jgi:hypothetical protein
MAFSFWENGWSVWWIRPQAFWTALAEPFPEDNGRDSAIGAKVVPGLKSSIEEPAICNWLITANCDRIKDKAGLYIEIQ